jgi:predicted  nucleic acid-binding Zn ribbon protein
VAKLLWDEKHKYKLLVPKQDSFYKQTNERKVDKAMKKVKRKE